MDSSAVNYNITVDDFDSILSYDDQGQWTTPDPSSPFFNAASSQWLMGTYHTTEVVNATVRFNFTGPAIFIYGYSGPDYGSYEVDIDSSSSTYSAYASSNGSSPHLLYGSNNLTYGAHQLILRNLGAQSGAGDGGGNAFLFDFLRFTVQLAPPGASVSNITLEETDPSLTYSGSWSNNTSGNFSGGGSAYTQEDQASVSFPFNGSAIYIFGDKKNDHGLYSITLDNRTPEIYNGISGCGGEFGMTCEQQQPTLVYFASNLEGGEHRVGIVNLAEPNGSFFDLDSIVLTIPSTYAPRTLNDSSSSSTSTSPTSTSASSTATSSNGALPVPQTSFLFSSSVLLLALNILWYLRASVRR